MKKLTLMLLTGLLASSLMAQETKTGWNFGALPAVTYSTDQGFQYGALVNLEVLPSFRPLINKYKFSYYDDVIQCYITGNNSQSYSGY